MLKTFRMLEQWIQVKYKDTEFSIVFFLNLFVGGPTSTTYIVGKEMRFPRGGVSKE